MKKYRSSLLFLLLWTMSLAVYAVDGDVVYSAPYIWVNPETGEIETVNPGPQLKNHEQVAAPAGSQTSMMGAAQESGPDLDEEAAPVAHTSWTHTLIVLVGMGVCAGLVTMMGRKSVTES